MTKKETETVKSVLGESMNVVTKEGTDSATVINPRIKEAFGLYLLLDSSMFNSFRATKADRKVEVLVSYNKVKKEYTFKEFFTLLGFENAEPIKPLNVSGERTRET